jgi:hypothetical protein
MKSIVFLLLITSFLGTYSQKLITLQVYINSIALWQKSALIAITKKIKWGKKRLTFMPSMTCFITRKSLEAGP